MTNSVDIALLMLCAPALGQE